MVYIETHKNFKLYFTNNRNKYPYIAILDKTTFHDLTLKQLKEHIDYRLQYPKEIL